MSEMPTAEAVEANVAEIRQSLTVWARHMAGRYNGPVYLTGSTLHNPDPRDCDVRIVVDDHEFAARYGVPLHRTEFNEYHKYSKRGLVAGDCCNWDKDGPSQRWIDDVAKFNAFLSQKLKRNMDVQVVPDSWYRDGIYPAPILLAAPSPHWWIYSAYCPDPSRTAPSTRREET